MVYAFVTKKSLVVEVLLVSVLLGSIVGGAAFLVYKHRQVHTTVKSPVGARGAAIQPAHGSTLSKWLAKVRSSSRGASAVSHEKSDRTSGWARTSARNISGRTSTARGDSTMNLGEFSPAVAQKDLVGRGFDRRNVAI